MQIEIPRLNLRTLILISMLITSATFSLILPHLSVDAEPQTPIVSVANPNTVTAPDTSVFNASVWFDTSESKDVFSYQVKMTVDDTLLTIVESWVPTGNQSWIFQGKQVIPITPVLEDKDGDGVTETMTLGSSLIGTDIKEVTGSALLATVQLQVLNTGTANININNSDTLVAEDVDMWGNVIEIPVEKQDGQVTIEGVVPTEPSQITIVVAPSTQITGENVTITGEIIPERPDVEVKIEQKRGTLPWQILAKAETNQTSQYILVTSFSEAATYLLRARWTGDQTYKGNVSGTFELTVKKPFAKVEVRFAEKDRDSLGNQTLPIPTPPTAVNVTVTNVTDLTGWKIEIHYDPIFIEVGDIWLPADNVLNLTGLTYNITINKETDHLYCEARVNQTGTGYAGNGTLFQFYVTGISTTIVLGEALDTTLRIAAGSALEDSMGNRIAVEYEDLTFPVKGSIPMSFKVVNPETGGAEFTFYTNETLVGDLFNATIVVEDAMDLHGWLIKLTYNDTLLRMARVIQPTDNTTYVFYGEESEMNFTSEDGGVVINNTLSDGEPFQENGLLVIIEFEILLAPTNETGDLQTPLTMEEHSFYNGLTWQTPGKEDGKYLFKFGARPSEDGEDGERSWLDDYWPLLLIGFLVVVAAVYLALRRRRGKGPEIPFEDYEEMED